MESELGDIFPPFPTITTPDTDLNGFHSRFSRAYTLFVTVAHVLQSILNDLCTREPLRLGFINGAIQDYFEHSTFKHKYNQLYELFDKLSTLQPSTDWVEFDPSFHYVVEFLMQRIKWEEQDESYNFDIPQGLTEIAQSTVYEIINIYDIDFIPETSLEEWHPSLSNILHVLSIVHEKAIYSEVRQPINIKKSEPTIITQEESKNPYTKPLDHSSKQIRILKIFPGTGSYIRCSLEQRTLGPEAIDMALSYVWGRGERKKCIWIDEAYFAVTERLYEILLKLRDLDPSRTIHIWIDAVCINQSDSEEKTHQVRLMRDIYTAAKQTIIWLSYTLPDATTNPNDFDFVLPEGLEEITVDRYDLCSIIKELQDCPSQVQSIEKKTALYLMLWCCIQNILLQEWWERTWTIQEAALPRSPPIFYFGECGKFQFSFDDMMLAMNMLSEVNELLRQTLHDLENGQEYKPSNALSTMITRANTMRPIRRPLLFYLRPGLARKEMIGEENLHTFDSIIHFTNAYKATNPQDKIFALQSLLPRWLGQLIHINYAETCEDTFTRATARLYNKGGMAVVSVLKLLVETRTDRKATPTAPSWVIDFTFSEAHRFTSDDAKMATHHVTPDGFIFSRIRSHPARRRPIGSRCFATPRSLFCSGIYIDRIWKTDLMNEYKDELHTSLLGFKIGREQRQRRGLGESFTSFSAEASSIVCFIAMISGKVLEGDFLDLLQHRYANIYNGDHSYFITDKGLLGMATTSTRVGDKICLLQGVPVYFILREVEVLGGKLEGSLQHRIVARAALNDTFGDLDKVLDSLPIDNIRIV
ncbi:heterokaryon incompatibility protein-domain-containing protein [Annulohypoxylon maeteangense]|uniref:heterokaryon incompatibility protein-domain-containing protein n=1 Tax=Annulohypoxylon maeteangense TaxID=1927788 RepID=UPI002007E3C3|nr:heterokaryon incompatibility protein-domain-containing protein [Annulohypoxylon maeteangense]KAI0880035.1 heterokaryon incompatibility protein-domain-containing protein [Annulohypoxylon maeteangense]